MMRYSQDGLSLTEHFEGVRLTAYQDQGGIWTIGYGHTGPDVYPGEQITLEQAQRLLLNDIASCESAVNELVTVPLTQGEFDALVDFSFNCGRRALENSTMLRMLNAGDYNGAAGQFERWDKVHGATIAGLLRRRQAEKQEFLAGME